MAKCKALTGSALKRVKLCYYCVPNLSMSLCSAAIDLLERMLDLDPDTRITAEEALSHEYLRQYSDPSDEPTSQPYDQSFEEQDFDVPHWKSMITLNVCKPV